MRQHATPLVIGAKGVQRLAPLPLGAGPDQVSEAALQQLIHDHPTCLPIAEIDPMFADPVPICTELHTTAGPIDNLLVTASGLPVLVECKLWRNPQARREVVGQILDYAKELGRWSSSDLQREVSRRLGRAGNVVLDLVRGAGHDVDETDFNDALTLNLRRGRFLLLIVGDGIREGVEAIAEYLQAHAGLHFTLGLVELPIYLLPSGERLVAPRMLARTTLVTRTVVAMPEGYVLESDVTASGPPLSDDGEPRRSPSPLPIYEERLQFWTDVLADLELDDPDQPIPSPSRTGHVVFKLGAPGGTSWITAYWNRQENWVGVFLSGNGNSVGQRAAQMLEPAQQDLQRELGSSATVTFGEDWPAINDRFTVNSLADLTDRASAIVWLRERINVFVNALRPRIREALGNLAET